MSAARSFLLLLTLAHVTCVDPGQALTTDFEANFDEDFFRSRTPPNAYTLLSSFGLGGPSELVLSDVSVDSADPQARAVLLVIERALWVRWYDKLNFNSYDTVSYLCEEAPAKARVPLPLLNMTDGSSVSTRVVVPFTYFGRTTLQIVYCGYHAAKFSGTLSLRTAPSLQFLAGASSGTLTHVATEWAALEPVLAVFLAIYFALFVPWSGTLLCCRGRIHRQLRLSGLRLCYCTLFAMSWKVMQVAAQLAFYQQYRRSGDQSNGIRTFAALCEGIGATAFLLLLSFAGLGLGISRTSLMPNEVWILSTFMFLHFLASLSRSFCSSNTMEVRDGSYDPDDTRCEILVLAEYVIQAVALLGIVIALNISIARIRFMLAHGGWLRTTTAMYEKLACFLEFRRVFMIFLLMPTVFLVVHFTMLSWRYDWFLQAMHEALFLVMYYLCGTALFRVTPGPYHAFERHIFDSMPVPVSAAAAADATSNGTAAPALPEAGDAPGGESKVGTQES